MLKLVLVLPLILATLQYASGVCNVCNDNGVACINEKDFYLCSSGKANTARTFSCLGENEICSKTGRACMDKTLNTTTPGCGDTSNCGICDGDGDNGRFTCTSRTSFTMCFGGELSEIRGTCPKNQICNVALGKQGQHPCVPSCREPEIEFCDLYDAIDVPATTTELPTTTEDIGETRTEETSTTPQETTVSEEIVVTTESIVETSENTEEATTTTVFNPMPETTAATEAQTSTTQNPVDLVCPQQTAVGRYPHPTDTTCRSYIYCFRKAGSMQTTILRCPGELYFDPWTTLCGTDKPSGCL